MAFKIGQRIPVEVQYLDVDGNLTEELDEMPVFSLQDPSLGKIDMVTPFKGFYEPKKTGAFKISVLAKDGGVDLLAEGQDVVGGKDAVKANLIFGVAEDVPALKV